VLVGRKAVTKTDKAVVALGRAPLEGTLLAIDPSSGSRGSMPGFAFFVKGVLKDAGTIQVIPGDDIHRRLFELRRSLMEDFSIPDVLITENIPPFMDGGFNKSVLNLHYSVGVVMSVFYCNMARIPPAVWRKYIPDNYEKTDRNDAIMLGYTAIRIAADYYGEECPAEAALSLVRGGAK
jgi:hypothetical protein